jgi:hypothetical protein
MSLGFPCLHKPFGRMAIMLSVLHGFGGIATEQRLRVPSSQEPRNPNAGNPSIGDIYIRFSRYDNAYMLPTTCCLQQPQHCRLLDRSARSQMGPMHRNKSDLSHRRQD